MNVEKVGIVVNFWNDGKVIAKVYYTVGNPYFYSAVNEVYLV